MDAPFEVHRSSRALITAASVLLLIICVWLSSVVGILSPDLGQSILFSLFALLFVIPFFAHICYLMSRSEPILSVYSERIELRNNFFPWRSATLSMSEI